MEKDFVVEHKEDDFVFARSREKRKPRDRLWSFLFTIVLSSSLLIGGINYAYNNAGSSGDDVPSPSEMEFGQACDGPLFLAKLEANNARYKVANSVPLPPGGGGASSQQPRGLPSHINLVARAPIVATSDTYAQMVCLPASACTALTSADPQLAIDSAGQNDVS